MTTDPEVCYITREVVQQAIDVKTTARNAARVDQCIAAASRDVEGLCHRTFYPWTGTRYKDWPSLSGSSYRVWLDRDELVSVSALVSGSTTIATGDYLLEPVNDPPYDRIEVNLGGSGSFSAGDTYQRSIAITGVFMGCELREAASGALAANIGAADTTLTVTDGSLVGVGSLLRIGTERLQVTEKTAVDTTQTINADLAANNGATTVAVDDGTAFHSGETVLVDSERLLVVDVAGNNVTVRRAWDGSVLATHTSGAAVYALRLCTVVRAVQGTTAAVHAGAAAVLRHVAPTLVQELTLAYTLTALEQGGSSYAATVGSGDNQRPAPGRGVRTVEDDCYRRHGRRARMRSST